ncbi:hypothetical protein JW865_04005 [Candidatus Bathyarchaeota archaeon]|nr:hypothetical protein [Candidatus Bathyarchaeota archaeon]
MSGFASALQIAKSSRSKILSTGSLQLDKLLGGISGGLYLFYGEEELVDEILIHLLVNALQTEEDSTCHVIYAICGNYRVERSVIEFEPLFQLLESKGLSPEKSLRKVRVLTASSADQQTQLAYALEKIIEEGEVKLVIVRGLYRLQLDDARKNRRDRVVEEVQRSISRIRQTCASHKVPVIASAREVKAKLLPRAEASSFLNHLASVTVYLRGNKRESFRRAYLVKSSVRPLGSIDYFFGEVDELGRNTPPLRDSFNESVARLRKEFRDALVKPSRREAFDKIVEAWSSEMGAITYAESVSLFDLLLLTATVDNRRVIEELSEKLRRFEDKGGEVG